MLPHSIRWRLPLSYGAIALLATACLGVVLLFTLRGYYTRQEIIYLERNAQALGDILGRFGPETYAGPLLQSQVNTFAYLTQTQVKIYDDNGRILADSGSPQDQQAVATLTLEVQLDDSLQAFSQTIEDQNVTTLLVIEDGRNRLESATSVTTNNSELALLEGVITPASFLETFTTSGTDASRRSAQTLRAPLHDQNGRSRGHLELSQGPALGQAILPSVRWGFAIAAAVAFLLATAVGWRMSLSLSQPIRHLAQATSQMASGNLTARAPTSRQDELGQLAHTFNHMADQVETTVTTLRHFVADAAHELNTPLTALRANLDLAGQHTPENRHIDLALAQAIRLEKLSDDLLSLSRLESGIATPEKQPLDLTQLLRDRSEHYAAQAEQADLNFNIELPLTAVTIQANAEQLLRAIDNLLDNAVKFTPANGTVSLTLSATTDQATLTVADTGIGLEESKEQLIFGRFNRGLNATNYPGSGLGLAIAQAIAHANNGRISAHPNPTSGTTFTLHLPITIGVSSDVHGNVKPSFRASPKAPTVGY